MLLELKGVKKYFSKVKAVDGVDLTIAKGENLSLVGESGCGKSTLGRIILKLLPPDSGRLIFEGKDITSLSANDMRPLRSNLQIVFQDPFNSLDPRFTVRRILLEALLFNKINHKEKQDKMNNVLSAVGFKENVLERFPHEFSGGERQRIAIARSLLARPKLLILDEATSSLDVLVQNQILNLLLDIQKKFDVTYLFITHNLRIIPKISQRTAVMWRGKIVEWAKTKDILSNPLHPYTKELLTAALDYTAAKYFDRSVSLEKSNLMDCGQEHFVRKEIYAN